MTTFKKARLVKYICISIGVVQKCGMAKLDDDDLNAIRDLIKVTFDEKLDEKLDKRFSPRLTEALPVYENDLIYYLASFMPQGSLSDNSG